MQLHIRELGKELLRFLVIAALALITIEADTARADSAWTQSSQADFEAGTLFQVDTASLSGDIKLAKSGAGADYIYALQGNRLYGFWRYDIAAGSWVSLANTPARVRWGGALAYDGGDYVYALRGYGTPSFWRYNTSTNAWSSLASTPADVAEGGALACDGGNYIYALRGDGTQCFWRYDMAADAWSSLADTLDNVEEGGALTYDGGNYIYAFQCEDTESFWRYDIAADTWSLMAETPDTVGNGAALAYDGSGYVYALRGQYSYSFWRYNIAANSWSVMTDTPESVEWGGALACDGNGHIYALRGKNTRSFWRYDTAADAWTWLVSSPASVYYGGALTMKGASYHDSGTLTSSTHDTGYPADFGNISWTATAPGGTSIKFQIATNSDNATWNFKGPDGTSGTYYDSSGMPVWSGHNNDSYIKYKAFLSTTDTAKTPVLHDITITYRQPVILPSVTTDNATLIEETAAVLNGILAEDGGEACQYQFEYDTDSGESYSFSTNWTGSLHSGQSFSASVTGLGKGTKYYFRAKVRNSSGTAEGTELSLLTKPDPPVGSAFSAAAVSSTQIDLLWTRGEGAQRTMIRRNTGDFPLDRDDGDLVYFDVGTSFSDTGLSPATTYYYRAWSEVSGSQQWSDGYVDATATTSGDPPPPPPPPTAVGGIVFQVNKAQVMAPWLCLFLALSLAVGRVAFSLRKRVQPLRRR